MKNKVRAICGILICCCLMLQLSIPSMATDNTSLQSVGEVQEKTLQERARTSVGIGLHEIVEPQEDSASTYAYGDTSISTYNQGGNSLSDIIGVSRGQLLSWLEEHINDTYYLTTPYGPGDYRNPNGDCNVSYGADDIPGQAAMNCTGFVWHALTAAGGDGDIIPNIVDWITLLRYYGIEYRTYEGTDVNNIIDTIVRDDGYIEPGDIIWTWDADAVPYELENGLSNGLSDYHHIGIYTGTYFDSKEHNYNYAKDIGDVNGWWNSADAGNYISGIEPLARCEAITVIKLKGNVEEAVGRFEDVRDSDWFYDSVSFVYDRDIMTGLNEFSFGSSMELSRSQFATILYRIAGSPAVSYDTIFPDVGDGKFYTSAIMWAYNNTVITGYEDGTFGPSHPLTREQLAVLMYRYAAFAGLDTSDSIELSGFPDAGNVSAFAKEAMSWAVGVGMIKGDQGNLNPQGNASRAQCATVIMRYMLKYGL